MVPNSRESLDGNSDSLHSLIDSLQSDYDDDTLVDEKEKPGECRDVPDDLLRTNPSIGLSDVEVAIRRRRYGWNELSEEKNHHFRKLLSFFVGPIEFVMEVSHLRYPVSASASARLASALLMLYYRLVCYSL